MSAALDIGTCRLKSLGCRGDRLIGRKCRTVHAVLPDTIARRQVLERMRIPFAACEDSLVVIGDAAVDVSQAFGTPVLPLLPGGELPQNDPPARQILATLVDAVLPASKRSNEFCSLILPAGIATSRRNPGREYEFFSRLVHLRGYTPLAVQAGMSVVLAQLADRGFTGIGMSFGAASTQVSLAFQGRQIASCSIPQGGDCIDEQSAESEGAYTWDSRGMRFVDLHTIRRWKENCDQSILNPTTRRDRRLQELYRQLLMLVVTRLSDEFAEMLEYLGLRKSLTIAAAGGPTRIPGFRELLAQTFQQAPLPLPVDEIRVAADSEFTIARGGLIYAQLETEASDQRAAA